MSLKNILAIGTIALGGVAVLSIFKRKSNRKTESKRSSIEPFYDPNKDPNIQKTVLFFDDDPNEESVNMEEENIKEEDSLHHSIAKRKRVRKNRNSRHKENTKTNAEVQRELQIQSKPRTEPVVPRAEDAIKENRFLGNIISMTISVLKDEITEKDHISYATIYKNWDTSLQIIGSKRLTDEYNRISKKEGIDPKCIDDSTAKKVIAHWMSFLTELGIQRYKDESLNENGNVVVTAENRSYYENGVKFPDGAECRVVEIPLTFKGEFYYEGKLETVENIPAKQTTVEAEEKGEAPAEPTVDTQQAESIELDEPVADDRGNGSNE